MINRLLLDDYYIDYITTFQKYYKNYSIFKSNKFQIIFVNTLKLVLKFVEYFLLFFSW